MVRLPKPVLRVAFDKKTGNHCEYAISYYTHVDWKDNYTFRAVMKIHDTVRGRSTAGWRLIDQDGRTYYMFMGEMLKVIESKIIKNGWVEGEWTFRKQGPHTSLKLVS